MPRNGHAAKTTTAARVPDDLYDSLSQNGQDDWDAIGVWGYRPFKGVGGVWWATKLGYADIGPSESLSVLRTMVDEVAKVEINSDDEPDVYQIPRLIEDAAETAEFDNDVDSSDEISDSPAGDGYLFPGMKPTQQKSYPELATAILNYESYKRERQDALTKEVEAKTKVTGLMRAKKDALAFDPKTGIHSYRVNDYIEELVPGEEKLKSRRVSDEDED